ncbi:hypothetical protein FB45DRAFT_137659 [Roridomyces roridus]|uniref:DUF6534 domain-containing protein n=1 Tax=Roridomyces roridus TaxID=1738132 RepID=A0AAD7BHW1_9AGAR|nr:hypothetical protein FB45DRAFT_137659 [Roridomyces roridus]
MSLNNITTELTIYIFGGWDLAVAGDLLLQGTLFAQFAHYNSLYKSDTPWLKGFVCGLLFLTTLKSAQMIQILWQQNVTHFSDVFGAANLLNTSWTQEINLAFTAIIAFFVQLFFCQRLWALSKNIYIVLIIFLLFVFALVASFVSTAFTFAHNPKTAGDWIPIHLSTVFVGDILLCGNTAFSLFKTSKGLLPQTAGMLNALLRLTFQSAVPAVVCALINLVANRANSKAQVAVAGTMLSIISNNALPKLYALSAMWTLNSRQGIRLAGSNGELTSSGEGQSGRRNNIELGGLSLLDIRAPIQVRTQTVQHVDPDIVFTPKLDNVSEHSSARKS